MAEKSLYSVSIVTENDIDGVMDLMKRTFFLDEPMNEAVGLCTETGTCEELENYCRQSLLEGLSFKVVDNDGNIIAVAINGTNPIREDIGKLILNMAEHCENPKFQKILYVLERREEGARLWEKFPQEKSLLEVKFVATDPNWRRKGIMNVLVKETENLAKQRGVRIIRLDTSSAYSAMSAESLGYNCIYKALYSEIKMNGEPLIVPKSPHVEDRVHIKCLF